MAVVNYIVTVPDYTPGYIVTFHVNSDNISSMLGLKFEYIELYDPSDNLLISTSDISFLATDYIYFNIDGQNLWEFSYKLYCSSGGEPYQINLVYEDTPNYLYAAVSPPITQGTKVAAINLQGGGKASIPIVSPVSSQKSVVMKLQSGEKVAIPLRAPVVGDPVAIINLQGGGKVSVPLVYAKEDKYVTLRVRVNFGDGGTHEIESTIFDSVEWLEITHFYGIPSEYNPFFFQYIEFYSQYNTKTATVQSVGASKDFGSQYNIEQVLTYYVKFYMGYLYIDKIQFRNYNTSEIYDLNGNGGFETDPTNWNITGDAEISTSEAYEGTHSLKLF